MAEEPDHLVTFLAEFVGGPFDGDVRAVPTSWAPVYRVPLPPPDPNAFDVFRPSGIGLYRVRAGDTIAGVVRMDWCG
jgi:hypothetical protein